jgi:hypothetical protein
MDAPLRRYLGWERFPENLTEPEIAHFFSLSVDIGAEGPSERKRTVRKGSETHFAGQMAHFEEF